MQEPRQHNGGLLRRGGGSVQVDVQLAAGEVRPHEVRDPDGQRALPRSRLARDGADHHGGLSGEQVPGQPRDLVLAAGEVGDVRWQLGEHRNGVPPFDASPPLAAQHPGVRRPQLRAGIDPQLVAQERAPLLVAAQRLGGAARLVQRQHQQAAQAFPFGVPGDQPGQLGDKLRALPHCQARVGQVLDGGQPRFRQAGALGLGPLAVHVEQSGAGPQVQGGAQQVGRGTEPVLAQQPPARGRLLGEHVGVDPHPVADQHVTGGPTGHRLAAEHRADRGHQAVQAGPRIGGQVVAPQRGDQRVGRHDPSRVDREHSQQCLGFAARDRYFPTVPTGLHGPQDADVHTLPLPRRESW